MPLLTTTIGAYPKPDYVAIPDWFTDRTDKMRNPTRDYVEALRALGEEGEAVLARATREVVLETTSTITVGIWTASTSTP